MWTTDNTKDTENANGLSNTSKPNPLGPKEAYYFDKSLHRSADIWALGVTLLCLVCPWFQRFQHRKREAALAVSSVPASIPLPDNTFPSLWQHSIVACFFPESYASYSSYPSYPLARNWIQELQALGQIPSDRLQLLEALYPMFRHSIHPYPSKRWSAGKMTCFLGKRMAKIAEIAQIARVAKIAKIEKIAKK